MRGSPPVPSTFRDARSAFGSYPPSQFRLAGRTLEFCAFAARCLEEMIHPNGFTGLGRQKGGVQGDIANVAAADVKSGELCGFQTFRRCRRRKNPAPDFGPLEGVGKWELHHEPESP